MSIESKLTRLKNAKLGIASVITLMGGTVNTGDGFEDFPSDIATIPQGSTEHGYKKWTITLPSDINAGTVNFVLGDKDIKEHYADDNAMARIVWDGDITSRTQNNIPFAANCNRLLYTSVYGINAIKGSSGTAVSVTGVNSPLKSASGRTGMLAAASSGNISFNAYTTRILPAGDYSVEFWW